MHPRALPIASLTSLSLDALLQPTAVARPALDLRRDPDVLRRALRRVHEADARLHLDVLAHVHLLGEHAAALPSPSALRRAACECAEKVVEAERLAETCLSTLRATEATETTETREWVAASCSAGAARSTARIEAALLERRSAICVPCFLLLRVIEELIRALCVGEFVLRAGIFVRVGVIFLREPVVCFLDLAGGGGGGDTEGFVRVLLLCG